MEWVGVGGADDQHGDVVFVSAALCIVHPACDNTIKFMLSVHSLGWPIG